MKPVEAYRFARRHVLQRLIPRSCAPLDLRNGVEVVGYLGRNAGISESARLCAAALRASGLHVEERDLDETVAGRDDAPSPGREPKVRIFHLNPPMMPRAVMRIGPRDFARTFNIGYWAWELETLPTEWLNALRYIGAVFVPSEFTRCAIAARTSSPVIVVPHPIRMSTAPESVRSSLRIGVDDFLVSTIFNPGSSFQRKNPLAVVDAYRRLVERFPAAWLVLKTGHSAGDAPEVVSLRSAIGDLPHARIVAGDWPAARISGLITDSDAYVSLHRSEGFGLTIAEAIAAGTPVVATNWSGNVDFCSPAHTWLVDATQVPVRDDHPEFRAMRDACWAEPSVAQAAAHLMTIASDSRRARATAALAADALHDWIAARSYASALNEVAALGGSLVARQRDA